MSGPLLYLWLKWTFGILIALGLYFELASLVGRFLKRKAKALYIDHPPIKDDRDSLELFRKMYPRKER